MRKRTILALLTLASLPTTHSQAATITETHSMMTTAAIPDGDLNGLVQTLTPTTYMGAVDVVTVSMTTTGGWNGDLYAYLAHEGGISILVNRPGRTSAAPDGSGTSGMTVTFDDTATPDFHSAGGGFGSAVVGSFQPDGRAVNPLVSLDTTPRTSPLANFAGKQAAGVWSLYVLDAASGDQATLQSWSITITGTAIPEPSASLLGGAAALGLLTRRRRG